MRPKLLGSADSVNTHFQLAKTYSVSDAGSNSQELATCRPIHKPVPNTVQVTINGATDKRWNCDYTSGQICFMPDETGEITAQSYDAAKQQLTLSAANSLAVGDSIHLTDMPELPALNEQRFAVFAATSERITIQVANFEDTDNYTGNGSFHTLPQPGEILTAGFEFDVPVRFASDSLSISSDSYQSAAYSSWV